jgi:hypothetical protein
MVLLQGLGLRLDLLPLEEVLAILQIEN